MAQAAFAKKLGMTHIYDESNRHIPVTILALPSQVVTGIRTQDKDGYAAVQIGAVTRKHSAQPQKAELTKHGIEVAATARREVKVGEQETKIGQAISTDDFAPGDVLTITSTSKGKGFAGGIKRHGWSRGPMSHGSKHHRAPGSIGSGYPQRVVPGKKLPGHLGSATVTTKGHKIMAINNDMKTLAVSGPVPGPSKSFVFIQKTK